MRGRVLPVPLKGGTSDSTMETTAGKGSADEEGKAIEEKEIGKFGGKFDVLAMAEQAEMFDAD